MFSIERSLRLMPLISVRTLMMRSPLRPEMRAQSSGLVVFGRSSFSLNSSRTASMRSSSRMPRSFLLDQPLHRLLLRPRHDVLDHRAAGEVLEVEDLALALRVGDLEELVLLGRRVHVPIVSRIMPSTILVASLP
jgi:hypothetical protein